MKPSDSKGDPTMGQAKSNPYSTAISFPKSRTKSESNCPLNNANSSGRSSFVMYMRVSACAADGPLSSAPFNECDTQYEKVLGSSKPAKDPRCEVESVPYRGQHRSYRIYILQDKLYSDVVRGTSSLEICLSVTDQKCWFRDHSYIESTRARIMAENVSEPSQHVELRSESILLNSRELGQPKNRAAVWHTRILDFLAYDREVSIQ